MNELLLKSLELAPEMSAIAIIVWMFLRHLTRYSKKCNEDLTMIATRYHSREGVIIGTVKENTAAMVELTDAVKTMKGRQYADDRTIPHPREAAQSKAK